MAYVSVYVDIYDMLEDLSSKEIQDLVDKLYDDGYEPSQLTDSQLTDGLDESSNAHDEMWFEVVDKIRRGRLQLNPEQESLIREIASKIV
jgi:hypothetical protein